MAANGPNGERGERHMLFLLLSVFRELCSGGRTRCLLAKRPAWIDSSVITATCAGQGRERKNTPRAISFGVPELEHFFVPFFFLVCGFCDCLFVDCVSGDPPTHRERERKQKMKSKLSTDFRWRRRLSTRRHRALLPSLIPSPSNFG
jgi:hypothetical protein